MIFDLDYALLFVALQSPAAFTKASKLGLREELFERQAVKAAYALAKKQHGKYGTLPTAEDIYAGFGITPAPTGMEAEYLLEQAVRRHNFNRLKALQAQIEAALSENDPEAGVSALKSISEDLVGTAIDHAEPVSLFSLTGAVVQNYLETEVGGVSVPFPWDSFNKMTGGMVPGTNTWFTARPGTGKTFVMVLIMIHIWKEMKDYDNAFSKRILIVSPEMLKESIAERTFAVMSKTPYGQIVGATLGAFGKKGYFDAVSSYASESGIWIMDAADGITPDRIANAVRTLEIDVLMIDAVYKIKWHPKAKDRYENMTEGVGLISQWAKSDWGDERKISVVASSQLGREGTKKASDGAVALTDTIFWEADNLFYLERTEEMLLDNRMRLITGKCRRSAAQIASIMIEMDMVKMSFNEVQDHAAQKAAGWKDNGF